jgi:hypothetical protein
MRNTVRGVEEKAGNDPPAMRIAGRCDRVAAGLRLLQIRAIYARAAMDDAEGSIVKSFGGHRERAAQLAFFVGVFKRLKIELVEFVGAF